MRKHIKREVLHAKWTQAVKLPNGVQLQFLEGQKKGQTIIGFKGKKSETFLALSKNFSILDFQQ